MRVACDLLVLLRDARFGADHHEHDIGTVDGAQRADDTVSLDCLANPAAAAHARRIDERKLHAVAHEMRIDRITRRSRDIADDDALLAEKRVDER